MKQSHTVEPATGSYPVGTIPVQYRMSMTRTYHEFTTGERVISTNNVARTRRLFCELSLEEQIWFAKRAPTDDLLEVPDTERRVQMALAGDFDYFQYKGWTMCLRQGAPVSRVAERLQPLFKGWELAWTAPSNNRHNVHLILATPLEDMTSVVVGCVRYG